MFELSEAQLSEAGRSGAEFVDAAHELGCRIALDGFIEGGRDTMLLRRFPISYVKLGHPFIGTWPPIAASAGWSAAPSCEAHRSGQRVIAQGVEDLATLELLDGLGVDEAQGHALGPPESLEPLLGAPA